jgi:tellurite resistance protein TerC
VVFGAVFFTSLALDLFVFQRKSHVIPVKEALRLVAFWIGLAAAFAVLIFFTEGGIKASEFIAGYFVEYSLSVDNLFVFLALFTYFAVPRESQPKVLIWGILGAIILRGIFIFAGITLVERFHFLLYILGAVLIITAVRLVTQKEKEVEPHKNPIVKLTRKLLRVKPDYVDSKFFVREKGLLYATPLVIVLVAIETMDIVFALDSVPAVFGISLDPFIVYTSNIFAVMGLRSLFFAISGLFYLFRYLAYGLCAILTFVGVKMLLADVITVPTLVSLGVVIFLLAASIIASVLNPEKEGKP